MHIVTELTRQITNGYMQ